MSGFFATFLSLLSSPPTYTTLLVPFPVRSRAGSRLKKNEYITHYYTLFGMLFQAVCLSEHFICLDFGGINVYPISLQSYNLDNPKCLFDLKLCTQAMESLFSG